MDRGGSLSSGAKIESIALVVVENKMHLNLMFKIMQKF